MPRGRHRQPLCIDFTEFHSESMMAGTLFGLPLSQPVDLNGRPQVGCKLYVYQSGSFTIPVTTYKDYGLTAGQEHPFPIPSDAWGRIPIFWVADGTYAFRLVDGDGEVLASSLLVQALGPSDGSGGGGGGSGVDENALFKTGDLLWQDVAGTRTGFVRDNARTIGSATSGATERANSDCESLYTFLWTNFSDTICPVTGGRGISAAADWAANKAIQSPDKRGRSAFGIDDMGNSAASRLSGTTFSYGAATTAGALGGAATQSLTIAQMPSHNHGGITGDDSPDHTHVYLRRYAGGVTNGTGAIGIAESPYSTGGASNRHQHSISSQGSGAAHDNMPPFVLGTFYRKL